MTIIAGGHDAPSIGQREAYTPIEKLQAEKPPEEPQQNKLRSFLSREWTTVALPFAMYAAADGFGRFAVNPFSPYAISQVIAAIVPISLLVGVRCSNIQDTKIRTFKRGCVQFALAASGAYLGVNSWIATAAEARQLEEARQKALPQITGETMIPAKLLCDDLNSFRSTMLVTINGIEHTLTCEKK